MDKHEGHNLHTVRHAWLTTVCPSCPRAAEKIVNIKPKPGGDLPFDFHGDGSIDLIVGSTWKKGVGEVTPFELLDDFDLTILGSDCAVCTCKCYNR